MNLLGIDVGGTFTDLVFYNSDSGSICVHKVASTPGDQSKGVLQGIREICRIAKIHPSEIGYITHGTTVATNALVTNKLARTGLITTRGFRDVLYIGRHHRPLSYSVLQEIPWHHRQPIQRRHRKEVTERLIPPDGEVLHALSEDETVAAIRELRAARVESIAVCFLFSYLNPRHELRVKELVEEHYPGCYVSTSAGVQPEFREFERFITTAINAGLQPSVSRYIANLQAALRDAGVEAELHVMQSNSGLATPAMACAKPVSLLMSGPAAGVAGGSWAARDEKTAKFITIDIGGTTSDLGVVTEAGIAEAGANEAIVAGFPVMAPMLDVAAIGAGGGSIAYLDVGGALHVGPQSAGAAPGPACCANGGVQPTVTDAQVLLGRLLPKYFLGGRMKIVPALAAESMRQLGISLGCDAREAAAAVIRIVNENMAAAIRERTVRRGHDPGEFSLIALGGAGPLHSWELAELLGIPRVIVPPHPGITAAMGLLVVDLRYDAVRSCLRLIDELSAHQLNSMLSELEAGLVEQLLRDGCGPGNIRIRRTADVRYVGQGYEVRIDLSSAPLADPVAPALRGMFEAGHQADYGKIFPGAQIELVTLRVAAFGDLPRLPQYLRFAPPRSLPSAMEHAEVSFLTDHDLITAATPFYDRARLPVDFVLKGPAVVVQMDSTTVVPPSVQCRVDERGSLVLTAENK